MKYRNDIKNIKYEHLTNRQLLYIMEKKKQLKTKLSIITSKIPAKEFKKKIGYDICTFLTHDDYKTPNVKRYTAKKSGNQFQITINQQNNKTIGFDAYSEKITTLAGKEKIVIILESPHEDEYQNTKPFHAITPANGATGRQIEGHLFLMLQKLDALGTLTKDEYEICIVNPVLFQTSLGSFTKSMDEKLKMDIWNHLWKNSNAKDKFIKLLKTTPDGSVVINSCTGKSLFYNSQKFSKKNTPYYYKKDYQTTSSRIQQIGHLVEKTIIDTLKGRNIFYTKTTHPSSNQGEQHYTNSINNMNILDLSK